VRPRVDNHVISRALNLRDASRFDLVHVGRLFCVASLERVLQANCPSLSAAFNLVVRGRVESFEQMSAFMCAAYASVQLRMCVYVCVCVCVCVCCSAPQLPRATRSSEFQSEDLRIFMDFGVFTGCDIHCFH